MGEVQQHLLPVAHGAATKSHDVLDYREYSVSRAASGLGNELKIERNNRRAAHDASDGRRVGDAVSLAEFLVDDKRGGAQGLAEVAEVALLDSERPRSNSSDRDTFA